MAAEIKNSPDTNPKNRFERDEKKFHYVNVEKTSERFPEGVLELMLDNTQSPTRPGEMMFEMLEDNVQVTGHARMRTLRCTVEDYQATLRNNDKVTREQLTAPDPSGVSDGDRKGQKTEKRITQGDDVIF